MVSVDFMGSDQTDENFVNPRKPPSDLHKLNTIRNYSFTENLNQSNDKSTTFKDLFLQSSELNSLKNKDFQTHKTNPLFHQEDNAKTEESLSNIVKIDVDGSDIKEKPLNKIKIQTSSNKEKSKSSNNNNSYKITIKSKSFNEYSISDETISNNEPIYMDPIDAMSSGTFSVLDDNSSDFSRRFSSKSTEYDSFSRKNYYPSISTESSSLQDSPKNMSFRTSSTVFRLQIRKKSEILSEV